MGFQRNRMTDTMSKTSEEQAREEHHSLAALREVHHNMAAVLNRMNTLENTLKSMVTLADNYAQFIPQLYQYKGCDKSLRDTFIEKVNEARKVIMPNG